MKYLYLFPSFPDGTKGPDFQQTDEEPQRDDLDAVYEGDCALLRFHNGAFELAVVAAELTYEEGEPKRHCSIEKWNPAG